MVLADRIKLIARSFCPCSREWVLVSESAARGAALLFASSASIFGISHPSRSYVSISAIGTALS